jgi:hypothetical protein
LVTVGKAPKGAKGLTNLVSIKEASPEALNQLLDGIKGKVK